MNSQCPFVLFIRRIFDVSLRTVLKPPIAMLFERPFNRRFAVVLLNLSKLPESLGLIFHLLNMSLFSFIAVVDNPRATPFPYACHQRSPPFFLAVFFLR